MSIWNKRGEFPKDFTDTRGLFVYQFDDGVDVEDYDAAFIYAANLIRWCRWNDLIYLEKENKQRQAEINRLREALTALLKFAENDIKSIETTKDFRQAVYRSREALNNESEECNEEQICDECFFESSKPLTDEEIKILEGQEK